MFLDISTSQSKEYLNTHLLFWERGYVSLVNFFTLLLCSFFKKTQIPEKWITFALCY